MSTSADLFELASSHHRAGDLARAELLYHQVLQSQPSHAEALYNLGYLFHQRGKPELATGCYQKALKVKPDHVAARNNLGVATMEMGGFEEAAACFRHVLQVQPDQVDAQNNLGMALLELGIFDQAEACYRQALKLRPELVDALNGLGVSLAKQGKFVEALAWYDRALGQDAGHAETHLNRSLMWLLQGDWAAGWPEYEWRWQSRTFPRLRFQQPRWDGSHSALVGRTILLMAEQGLGDTLLAVRFVPLVRQFGGRVIVQCQSPLRRLLSSCLDPKDLVARGEPLPPFDVFAPLLSLPGLLQISLSQVPAEVPYLHADAGLVQRWHRELEELKGFKIGISWQGNPKAPGDRQRSVPLARFAPLAQVEGVRLISLQKGPGTEQIASVGSYLPILDLGCRLDEAAGAFMDTAAIVENLDLVISADTAIAHLAGALAAPVWVALPLVPDWRWLLERQDSPWYPGMRLFRQGRLNVWEDVFERMAAELPAAILQAGRPF